MQKLNTPTARALAKLYEQAHDEPFPAGIKNAVIVYASKPAALMGGWRWWLGTVNGQKVKDFGSAEMPSKCAKQSALCDTVNPYPEAR